MNTPRIFFAALLFLLPAALPASEPVHEVLYQWELGPAQVGHTEFTETADGSFIGAGAGAHMNWGAFFG